jgi:hypothetical protein
VRHFAKFEVPSNSIGEDLIPLASYTISTGRERVTVVSKEWSASGTRYVFTSRQTGCRTSGEPKFPSGRRIHSTELESDGSSRERTKVLYYLLKLTAKLSDPLIPPSNLRAIFEKHPHTKPPSRNHLSTPPSDRLVVVTSACPLPL